MNKNMAAGHVLAVLLQISLVCFNTFYVISATKCADKDCKVPISMAVAVKDYKSGNEKYLSFKRGDVLSIYGKYVEGDNSIWQGSLRGMPAKFLRSDLVKEKVKFVNEDKLIDVFPNSASEGLLKDTENDGGPLESQHHAEEEQDLANEDDSVADMSESRDVFSEDPSTTDDQSKVEELDPGLNEAPNEEDDEATLGAAMNEGEDGGKPNQEELVNENKVESSQTRQENVLTNDGEALDDEDTNPQSTMEDNDEDVVDKTKKTEVYTDPTGVQYDVQIEYFDPAEKDNNEGVKVVGVTEQPQSNVDEDDLPEKAVTDKGTVDNPETPSSDEDNRQLKKNGFFSSVRTLVSDFTENIIKDFQGEEQLKGKETKNQLDGGTEETVNDEVTNDGEQREAEVESQKDETNTKPSFHERLQQIKAARVEEIKDKEEVKKDSRMSSRIDEEEVLKEKAKRTVEGIPGLMKEDKNKESEAAGEQMLNQNTVSQGNGAGSQKAPQKQYSDKVLCKSVPVKEREVCMASGSKEECLQDNCCYDESAAPGQQCFFKPSAPESGFSDEELQKLLSDDDEKVPMKNENDVELSDSGKSTTEKASETADVSSESKKELKDVQVDNEKKLESVDQGTGNGDSTGEMNLVKSHEDLDSRTEVNEPDDDVYKSNSVNKTHGSSLKDSSLEKSPTAETIESTTTSGTKQAVERVSEGREDYKQNDTTTGGTAEPENIADEAKSDSEETGDGGEAIATGVKTSAESGNKEDISNKDKTIVNKQQPSGGGVLTNETSVDLQEVRRDDSDSEEVDELTTAGSSVGTENEKSSMGNIAEERAVENKASEVKSAQDSEGDQRSAQDSEDDKSSAQASLASLGDVEEKGISSAGEKMTSEARESGEKEVEQELKHSLKKGEENEGDGESRDKNNGDAEDGDENKDGSGENRNENKEVGGKDGDKNKEVGVEGADEKKEVGGNDGNKKVGGEDADENKEVGVEGADENKEVGGNDGNKKVGGEDADENEKVGGEDGDKNKEVGVEGADENKEVGGNDGNKKVGGEDADENEKVGGEDGDKNKEVGVEGADENKEVGGNDGNKKVGGEDADENEKVGGKDGDKNKEVGVEGADENKEVGGNDGNKKVGGEDADENEKVGGEDADQNKEVGGEDEDENKKVGGEDADENKKVGGGNEDKNKEVGVEGGGNKQGDGEVSDENKNVKETKVDDDVELESNGGDPKSNSSSQQELSGKESISDESNDGESQMSEAKITESAGRADEIEHPYLESKEKPSTQDFASSETAAAAAAETSSVKDIPREKEETLPEDNVDKKHGNVPDAEGIFDAIKKFLPGSGSKKEDTKSNGQTSDEVLAMKKPVISENDNDRRKVHEHSQESNKNIESNKRENVKDDEANLKTDRLQENSEIDEADSIEDVSDEDFDKSQTSAELESEKMLKALLEEESWTSHDAAHSEISITDTEVEREIENKSAESGSTRFLDVSENTLPVEKTGGVNGSSSQESEATDTGIKEANEVKETITGTDDIGVNGTEPGVNKTSEGADVVPSKTSAVGPSETITTGYRTEEKKLPNIAAKWMKNTLIKGKRMAQKGTEVETSEGVDEKLDAENVDKGQHTGNLDGSLDLEDPYSGTCAKDGTCEGGTPFSRSVSLNGDNLADDDIVEPSPRKEESKVRRGTLQKYHDLAAEYVLPLLKPVGNVVKSLGEQMGLGETVDYLELKIEHGPTGVVSVPLILIAFLVYFMLCFLCRPKVPPSYGPNLKDIFLTYEGRIRILEEDCSNYEEEIKNLKNKVDEDGENSSVLGKQLEEERHERHKSNEQISLLKKIHKELNEKVNLLEEESANLKQSLAQKTECVNTVEEELTEKSNEVEAMEEKNKQLEDQLREKDGEKNVLNEQIEEYKTQLSKAEDDTDRHKTMLQDWNDRYHELQQKNDDISVNNQTLEEQIHFKDNEIEVLREALVQINSDVHINSDEELPQEEMQEAKAKKVKELMDVSQIRTDYKLCKEEKEKLEDDIKEEVEEREKLEGKVEQLEIDLAKSKASEEEMRFKYREADIKLNALQDYFKNMESDLHRKLTAEEAARMASESELERKLREASTAVQDVELYRKQVEELRKEIDETQLSFRSQISSTEERAHENWLKFRTAERELEEMRRERDALRRRLYDLETAVKAPAPLEDSLTSTTTDNLESPQPRSESPATSIRSSKRKSSNPRKSPSGSPMDERKERVRRKTRDRNSPPSWEADMGPPPRRRDKDRETPPPPPSLWEPNMGSRRKGQRESPGMDTERKRRDRYTPSPPPPPENSRRRRRDRPTPSSSPPPPPPPAHVLPPRRTGIPLERSSSPPPPPPAHVLSSRGMRMPLERSSSPPPPPPPAHVLPPRGTGMPLGRSSSPPPPAHVLSPAGLQGFAVAPMRAQGPMNAPFSRPPQDMMAPRPVRNGVPRAPFGNTPPPRYIRGGVGIPEQRVRGPPPTAEFPGTSPARYAGPPLVNTVSPPRGMQPQGVASYEQSPLYNNSNFSNNTPVNDQPPPPPLFASNGPYRRPPPRKVQTQPS